MSSGEVTVLMNELKGESNAFCTEQQTVSVGLVRSGVIVQTCRQCLRVVQAVPAGDDNGSDSGLFALDLMALQDVVVEEDLDMGGFGGTAGKQKKKICPSLDVLGSIIFSVMHNVPSRYAFLLIYECYLQRVYFVKHQPCLFSSL